MLSILNRVESKDGTVKFSFSNAKGAEFESVFFELPFKTTENYVYTICVSSQAGCALNCRFCATGLNGFSANLETNEMCEQVEMVRLDLLKQSRITEKDRFHIALMGMGEPMLNYDNVMNFYGAVCRNYPNLNKVSVSTVGIIPKILKLANDSSHALDLFVSIHSPYNEQRSSLIPISKKYPLSQLIESCKIFALQKNTFVNLSYLLINNFNDSEQHALDFIKLITPTHLFRVQLLLYNKIDDLSYRRPTQQKIEKFKDLVSQNNIEVMIVKSRGRDMNSGCGQLVRKK